jgi:parallel beta-helix repeat protein
MRKTVFVMLAMALVPFCAFAVDGVVLINQSTVMAAGGFPYVISQAGSYRLSGNLTVPDANTTAISVNADNVTIDLNGFSIIGPTVCVGTPVTSCSPTGSGVGVNGNLHRNITVVNGTVRGMGQDGLAGGSGGSSGVHVEKMHADSNGRDGIIVSYGTVIGNTVTGNGREGISADHSTVSGNTVTGNHFEGISVSSSTVSGNTSSFNGSYGIAANCPSSIVGNTATNNIVNLAFGAGCANANNAAP